MPYAGSVLDADNTCFPNPAQRVISMRPKLTLLYLRAKAAWPMCATQTTCSHLDDCLHIAQHLECHVWDGMRQSGTLQRFQTQLPEDWA